MPELSNPPDQKPPAGVMPSLLLVKKPSRVLPPPISTAGVSPSCVSETTNSSVSTIAGGNTLLGFFTSNKLGMTPAGGFWSGGLLNSGMEPGSFDTQFWPEWKSQRHQLGVCGPWILDGGRHEDQAWDFLKHYKKREIQDNLGHFNPVPLTTPTRRSLNTEERFGPTGVENWRVFYDTIDERPDTGPIAQPVFVVELTNIFTRFTSLATSGEQTPKEALDNMQAQMEDLYARNA